MKVSEIPYKRYTVEQAEEVFRAFCEANAAATCVEDVIAARKLMEDMSIEAGTAEALAYNRFSLNTKDPFYQEEMAYYDQAGPLFSQISVKFADLMLESPFRAELEQRLNPQIFKHYVNAKKSFAECITEDVQQENAVITEYDKFMGDLLIDFRGEKLPLSVVRGKMEDTDRALRREAAEAIGRGLEAHREELDGFYDRLVHIRDTMAKKMGYKNYVELGYYRMGRIDYDVNMVRVFRENVKRDIVPVVRALKQEIAEVLGIDSIHLYDEDIYMQGDVPKPVLDKEPLFAAAQEMYDRMHPEVGDFMRMMQANEAFDVDSREGKLGGGYCILFPKYKQPFIFANFNGSSGDVDVITHEFGHALADYFLSKEGDEELGVGGMETAECHSMSMEFFSWPSMEAFFGKNVDRYRYKHLLSALSFIPYGVIVDEFQEKVYEHPEYTPQQRKELWLSLERDYRPYLSYEGIPYLSEGTRWQYQMHIYERPFYYIDYCLAQTVALSFLVASLEDYSGAFDRYLTFVRTGGSGAFEDTVRTAGLPSPFDKGALANIAAKVLEVATSIRSRI